MDSVEARMHELGYRFRAEVPARTFRLAKVVGEMVYVSGHGPQDEHGQLVAVGRVGSDVTIEQGYLAAQRVAINCLGTLKATLGDLTRIEEVVKVLGFINSAPDFHRQPEVLNGFTDLLLEVLGEKGNHARSAIGTSNLPNNQSVEVEMIVRIRG